MSSVSSGRLCMWMALGLKVMRLAIYLLVTLFYKDIFENFNCQLLPSLGLAWKYLPFHLFSIEEITSMGTVLSSILCLVEMDHLMI